MRPRRGACDSAFVTAYFAVEVLVLLRCSVSNQQPGAGGGAIGAGRLCRSQARPSSVRRELLQTDQGGTPIGGVPIASRQMADRGEAANPLRLAQSQVYVVNS